MRSDRLARSLGRRYTWLLCTIFLWVMGCNVGESQETARVEYYQNFLGNEVPLRLVGRITQQEAEANADVAAYFVAHYDEKGRLVRVTKMFRGSVAFDQTYSYYASGRLKRLAGTNPDGEHGVWDFDERGRRVLPSEEKPSE